MRTATPGPWWVYIEVPGSTPGIYAGHSRATSVRIAGVNHERDAKLIAAAPRMADELEQFMRDHASKLDCGCPLCLRFGATLRAAGRLP